MVFKLFAILQKYDFSSKSQHNICSVHNAFCCLRYCKSTIFQANHNRIRGASLLREVVCDTAKVRFFKQITTRFKLFSLFFCCLRYCKSTIFQANHNRAVRRVLQLPVVCDTAKVRFFKQITTLHRQHARLVLLFAILQKYDFSSKSQPFIRELSAKRRCLRYCKSTIFQANHNKVSLYFSWAFVVCDTAKVRFFKQITPR